MGTPVTRAISMRLIVVCNFLYSWDSTLICCPRVIRKLMGTPVTRAISMRLIVVCNFLINFGGNTPRHAPERATWTLGHPNRLLLLRDVALKLVGHVIASQPLLQCIAHFVLIASFDKARPRVAVEIRGEAHAVTQHRLPGLGHAEQLDDGPLGPLVRTVVVHRVEADVVLSVDVLELESRRGGEGVG